MLELQDERKILIELKNIWRKYEFIYNNKKWLSSHMFNLHVLLDINDIKYEKKSRFFYLLVYSQVWFKEAASGKGAL